MEISISKKMTINDIYDRYLINYHYEYIPLERATMHSPYVPEDHNVEILGIYHLDTGIKIDTPLKERYRIEELLIDEYRHGKFDIHDIDMQMVGQNG